MNLENKICEASIKAIEEILHHFSDTIATDMFYAKQHLHQAKRALERHLKISERDRLHQFHMQNNTLLNKGK